MVCINLCVFVFKQKTAYELRSSDWSSDVCSSDLPGGSVDQFNFRITSGNPFIDPYRATNYDVALEWYFAPGAIASVALFAKDIVSFPLSDSFQGTYADSGLPTSLLTVNTPAYNAVVRGDDPNREFEYRTPINGPGANLKGVELRSEEHTSELK